VEIAAGDVDGGQLIVGDGDAFWVARLIQTTAYGEAGIGARCGDEFDDDLVGEQGLPSPVAGYEGEEPVTALPSSGSGNRGSAPLRAGRGDARSGPRS